MITTRARPRMVAYWESKEDTHRSEWEDGASYDAGSGRFAVADGASTGSRSREWAFSLVKAFVEQPPAFGPRDDARRSEFARWLDEVRERFDPDGDEYSTAKTPAWVQQQSKQSGAYATLLAGEIDADEILAMSYGDCCLFHLRADGIASFPAGSAEDFGSSPELLTSKGSFSVDDRRLSFYEATFDPRDMVIVASDAFGEWLIGALDDPDVWRMITRIGRRGFTDLCAELRHRGLMKNDDVTMLRIEGSRS